MAAIDFLEKKLCPAGKAAAKRKFKVYPSAYANGWAVQYCRGKFRGKKKGKKKLLKGKEDAPNYRKATGDKKCGNCKAWDSSKTDDPMTGYCEWYDFICRADHVCDAWAGKE